MNDLLNDALFSVEDSTLTLPGILARLSTQDDLHYQAMQAHQHHIWHMFLVQVATAALLHAGQDQPFEDEESWREALLGLHEDPSMWWLEQPDLSRPAFLQAPLPDGTAAFTKQFETPDALDVLATAKNHDVKGRRLSAARPEHWVFALVDLQTSSNFGGKFNYGTVRMNSGYGSRPCVSFCANLGWGSRFREDVFRILDRWEFFLEDRNPEGLVLLWGIPFAFKTKQLLPNDLHPLFIEVCRRIRLHDGVWHAGVSDKERLLGKELKGNLGDPWMPIKPEGGGLTARSLHYPLLFSLLTDFRVPEPMRANKTTRWLVCDVLAANKTETAGFHHRALALPPKVNRWLHEDDAREALARLGKERLECADTVRKRCVLPALLKIYDEDLKTGGGFRGALAQFNSAVDEVFFPSLWESLLNPEGGADRWTATLREIGAQIVDAAATSAPKRSGRPFQRRAVATSIFEGSFHNQFVKKEA